MQKIKKGDLVKVLIGKDSSKEGVVDHVLSKEGKIVIMGINVVKRHISGKKVGQEQGGEIEISKPINISNVVLICPNCKKMTRVGVKLEGAERVRVCKKCGKEIESKKGAKK